MARVVVEGVPHHITQRGNDRRDIFLSGEDRRFYIDTLRAKCAEHGVAVLGYCLMTNHVHLVAIPKRSDSFARALGQTHSRYALRFNNRRRRSGHLFQNRFFSCPLGPDRLLPALVYVDRNPVRARLVRDAGEYPWSSAQAHTVGVESDPLLDPWAWSETGISGDWKAVMAAVADGTRDAELRRASQAGIPYGDDRFVARMERLAGRRLRLERPVPKSPPDQPINPSPINRPRLTPTHTMKPKSARAKRLPPGAHLEVPSR